jgi:hypothetical protein
VLSLFYRPASLYHPQRQVQPLLNSPHLYIFI